MSEEDVAKVKESISLLKKEEEVVPVTVDMVMKQRDELTYGKLLLRRGVRFFEVFSFPTSSSIFLFSLPLSTTKHPSAKRECLWERCLSAGWCRTTAAPLQSCPSRRAGPSSWRGGETAPSSRRP